jgi:hypothetical protein
VFDIARHYLSACIGETRVARLAGMKHATTVTIASTTGTTANVVGSFDDTPNRRLDISRVTLIDAAKPTIVPVPVRMRPGRNARPRMSRGIAPNANRMPNSCALADDEGHHTISPQCREQKRRHGKDRHQEE